MSGSRADSQICKGWTKEQYLELLQLHSAGLPVTQIAAKLGKTRSTVHHKLLRQGIIRSAAVCDAQTEATVAQKLKEGASYQAISKGLGVSVDLIRDIRRRYGIDSCTVRTFSATEAAYLAGIVDGEGTILLSARGRKQLPRVCVCVANTNFDLIRYMGAIIGCGAVSQHTRRHHKNSGNRRDQMRWTGDGRCAIRVLQQILPYMICKPRQAKIVIEFYEKYATNHPYELTTDECGHIKMMVDTMHALNRKGRA
jgi:DNA-binding CsgD family transcriptional regulator